MPFSLNTLLKEQIVEASAPCRIDSGGTWDIKAMALPLNEIEPTTVNIALNLRTHITLFPFKDNWVKVSSEGFQRSEAFKWDCVPFNSTFGLFFAAITSFGFHGVAVHITSRSPVKSALGGSSTALVALIKALSEASAMLGGKRLSRREILHLGYHLEDGSAEAIAVFKIRPQQCMVASINGNGSIETSQPLLNGCHFWIEKVRKSFQNTY